MIDQTTIGTMLLCLATNSKPEHFTWQDLDRAIRLRIEESTRYVDLHLNQLLDEMLQRDEP